VFLCFSSFTLGFKISSYLLRTDRVVQSSVLFPFFTVRFFSKKKSLFYAQQTIACGGVFRARQEIVPHCDVSCLYTQHYDSPLQVTWSFDGAIRGSTFSDETYFCSWIDLNTLCVHRSISRINLGSILQYVRIDCRQGLQKEAVCPF